MHRALCNIQSDIRLNKEGQVEMESDFLKDFSEKWQLNKKTERILEVNNLVFEEDFLDLSDFDIENLGLTIGQKNALKRGIAVAKLSRSMHSECGDDSSMSEKRVSPISTNIPRYIKMNFLKQVSYQALRYVFLFLLIGYHFMAKLWQSLSIPFQPIKEEAKKVPQADISIQGMLASLKRFAFLAVLALVTVVQSILEKVMQPVYNIVENMSDFVERHAPPSSSSPRVKKSN